jgi:serine phosphatase RsbU (regulator of sigma subunit)
VSLQLGDGDTLLLLSDGVVEAHNHAGELFGFERLERSLAALPPTLSVQALVERILDGVLQFTDGAEPHDDMTLIALRPAALADRPMAQAEETAAPLAALGR